MNQAYRLYVDMPDSLQRLAFASHYFCELRGVKEV